jgi:hypothetical protein
VQEEPLPATALSGSCLLSDRGWLFMLETIGDDHLSNVAYTEATVARSALSRGKTGAHPVYADKAHRRQANNL